MNALEQVIRDTLLRELENYNGLYVHVETTKDVTVDGVLDVDAIAIAVAEAVRNV